MKTITNKQGKYCPFEHKNECGTWCALFVEDKDGSDICAIQSIAASLEAMPHEFFQLFSGSKIGR